MAGRGLFRHPPYVQPRRKLVPEPAAASPQAITLGLLDQTAALFAPTVTPGAVNISLALTDRTAATFAPTVTSTRNLTLGLITQTASPFTPTVTATRNLTIALLSQTAATFTPTVSATYSISLGLINQAAATFNPTVTSGAAAVTLGLISQTAATFTPTVTPGAVNVSLPLIGASSVSDDFNRADSTSSLGSPWVTDGGTWGISSNKAYFSDNPFPYFARVYRETGVPDAVVEADITIPAGYVQNQGFGLLVRYVDTNNHIRIWNDNTDVLTIQSIQGGVIDSTPIGIVAKTWTPGQTYHWKVVMSGNTYQVFIDGVDAYGSVKTDANSRHLTATKHGLYGYGQTYDVRWDNFSVAAIARAFGPSVSTDIALALLSQTAATFAPSVSSLATISLALLDRTAATFAPTITTTASVSVALINQTATASTPTVTTANSISVALINQTATTFTPTVTSLATISVALINQAAATFSPTVATGASSVSLGLIDQTAATFTPTVTPGAVNVSLALIDRTATASAPSVSTDIALALINQVAVTFTPTVSSLYTVSVGLINQTATTSAPTITTANSISLGLINQQAIAYTPTVSTTYSIALGLIDQTATPFDPSVSAAAGGQDVSLALLNQAATASAPFVINAPEWTTPADNTSMAGLPELKFLIPLMPSDMHFHIQIDTANTYDTGDLREIRSDLDQTGWDFWNGSGWEPVPVGGVDESYAGNEARYTVQSALSPSSTWYRRVRAGVVE